MFIVAFANIVLDAAASTKHNNGAAEKIKPNGDV